jgi:hypothetical protein
MVDELHGLNYTFMVSAGLPRHLFSLLFSFHLFPFSHPSSTVLLLFYTPPFFFLVPLFSFNLQLIDDPRR